MEQRDAAQRIFRNRHWRVFGGGDELIGYRENRVNFVGSRKVEIFDKLITVEVGSTDLCFYQTSPRSTSPSIKYHQAIRSNF